jgi:hypothetical protein
MRGLITCIPVVAVFAIALESAQAASADLTQWFLHATAYQTSATGRMTRPDFLPGNSLESMSCVGWHGTGKRPVILNGIWELAKYDRRHHIALAAATTDQCSVALFEAPTPAVNAPDADLSQYSTGRGLRIGSTYKNVLSIYGGPPAKHSGHFVAEYGALVPAVTESLPHKRVQLDESITIVIDNDRVSAITISVDEGALF